MKEIDFLRFDTEPGTPLYDDAELATKINELVVGYNKIVAILKTIKPSVRYDIPNELVDEFTKLLNSE